MLNKNPDVEYAEPNITYQALLEPDDTEYNNQWSLPKIDAPEAWDIETGPASVDIAIIDTGINGTHEDLNGKVLAGYDFINNVPIVANTDSDDMGHGTAVAGVASALTNNATGIAGVAWDCDLMPVKVLDAIGYGTAEGLANGIIYAADNGAEVINMSLGGTYSSTVANAVNYAEAAGVIMAAASGNYHPVYWPTYEITYPARLPNTLAVGSVDSSDVRASNSCYGPELDVVAPGVSILTTYDTDGYGPASGTSLASPHVAGLVALILAQHPGSTLAQVRDAIRSWADNVAAMGGANFTNQYGYGRINAHNSLRFFGASDNPSTYIFSWVTQNGYPSLNMGDSYEFNLTTKNEGSSIWYKDIVRLGTSHPHDRVPSFTLGTGWISSNRVEMVEPSVAPGANAHFVFTMQVPIGMSSGVYREYFQVVADGIMWLQDYGIYWDITVL
jgi:subtilisin family serine protease